MIQTMVKNIIVTISVFLVGDILWLSCIMKPFFVPKIKHLMNASDIGINYGVALLAYILISAALVWFVVIPLRAESLINLFLNGAFLGLCMYGVYECTNYATLAGWPLSFFMIDIIWGTVWCGLVSAIAVLILRLWS